MTTETTLKAGELEAGTHFWANLDGQLVMMMKDVKGDYYVCGGWECSMNLNEFNVIKLIPFPDGYQPKQLYYFGYDGE